MACFVGGSVGQQINPGVTMVPPRILANAEEPAATSAPPVYALPSFMAPLSLVDKKLPKWIQFSGHDRLRLEGYSGLNYQPSKDMYVMNRFRIGMLLHPMRGFRVYAEMQDARALWKNPPLTAPYENIWHLRQGWVQVGGGEDQPFGVRVGRQQVNFGAGRLIGYSDWRNAGGTFDAALATFRLKRYRLTAFSLSPIMPVPDGFSHHVPGNAVHGLYGGIDNVLPHTVLEPYVLWHVAPGYRTDVGSPAKLDEWKFGVRWAGIWESRLDYAVEIATQKGSIANDSLGGAMASIVAGYMFTGAHLKVRVFVEYFYASGDRSADDRQHETWDQLYPTNHDRNGMADQVGWQNVKEFRSGARIGLTRNVAVATVYSDWHLASGTDGFYNASGSVIARDSSGRSGTHIGQELDLEFWYRISREVELGAGLGHIFPGSFLKHTTPGNAYTYPYVMINYVF